MFWRKKLTQIGYVQIGYVSDLPAKGGLRQFCTGDQMLCVANVGGKIVAVENQCPHAEAPLGQGKIENGKIVCPVHFYGFDPVTGACDRDPSLSVRVFEVLVKGKDVLVRLT